MEDFYSIAVLFMFRMNAYVGAGCSTVGHVLKCTLPPCAQYLLAQEQKICVLIYHLRPSVLVYPASEFMTDRQIIPTPLPNLK